MSEIHLSKVTIHDIENLQKIGRQTFSETFANENSEANMNKYLAEGFSTKKISEEINNPNTEFYFALYNDHIVGYLKLNVGLAQSELQAYNGLEIERIYVLQKFQGQKIGQILFEKALQIAKHKEVDYIWLGVWEKNLKAINFYKKNGFVEFDQHIFNLGNDEQIDIMMKLILDDNFESP